MPPYRTIPSNEEPKKFGHNMHVVLELTIGIALRSQRLHWTLPSLSTPVQCERWSDLMPLMTWQLWLAKDLGLFSTLCDNFCLWNREMLIGQHF